jgi:hypothetical protein
LGGTTLLELPGGVKIAGQAGEVIILGVAILLFTITRNLKGNKPHRGQAFLQEGLI